MKIPGDVAARHGLRRARRPGPHRLPTGPFRVPGYFGEVAWEDPVAIRNVGMGGLSQNLVRITKAAERGEKPKERRKLPQADGSPHGTFKTSSLSSG